MDIFFKIIGIIGFCIICDLASLPAIAKFAQGKSKNILLFSLGQMSCKFLLAIILTLLAF
jgi:hypothetical protein